MNESDFIAALRTLPLHAGARALEDDCAVLELGGETLILTHDMMAEGTHFLANQDMADVAWKLVATNLSDLAAKGAEPVGVMLGHCLSADDERFLIGLHEALNQFEVPLLGGDTISAGASRVFGLTAIGRATHLPVPDRGLAKPGDAVFVTGTLGRAMLGLEEIGSGSENDLAYRRPAPLLAEGRALAPHVSAMMDVSDGLLLDSWRIAVASKVTLQLDSAAFPVADQARLDECIRWGDDYELLFTAPEDCRLPVPAHRIGKVEKQGPAPLRVDGKILTPEDGIGYRHG
ncbi:MAG: thiamine-phosphate kinase [Erythrobacter sp.]